MKRVHTSNLSEKGMSDMSYSLFNEINVVNTKQGILGTNTTPVILLYICYDSLKMLIDQEINFKTAKISLTLFWRKTLMEIHCKELLQKFKRCVCERPCSSTMFVYVQFSIILQDFSYRERRESSGFPIFFS